MTDAFAPAFVSLSLPLRRRCPSAAFDTHEYTNLQVPSAVAAATEQPSSDQGSQNQSVQADSLGAKGDAGLQGSSIKETSDILFVSASEAAVCICPRGMCQKGGPGCCHNCPGAQDVCAESPPSPQTLMEKTDQVVDQVVPVHPISSSSNRVFLVPHSMCCASPATYSNQFIVSCPIVNH